MPDNFIYKGEIMLNTEKYLLALVLGFSFMSTAVIAQDTDEDTDVEEVVVTGSRIATSEFTGAQPVIVLDQEVIARTAELTISDVLRELPINIAGSDYERSGSSAGGTSEISLRGLGSSRTLVLIDGRRVPAHPKTAVVPWQFWSILLVICRSKSAIRPPNFL